MVPKEGSLLLRCRGGRRLRSRRRGRSSGLFRGCRRRGRGGLLRRGGWRHGFLRGHAAKPSARPTYDRQQDDYGDNADNYVLLIHDILSLAPIAGPTPYRWECAPMASRRRWQPRHAMRAGRKKPRRGAQDQRGDGRARTRHGRNRRRLLGNIWWPGWRISSLCCGDGPQLCRRPDVSHCAVASACASGKPHRLRPCLDRIPAAHVGGDQAIDHEGR